MSEAADRDRVVKRSWARPGGFHDWLVRILKVALPAAVGVLLAYMLLSPLSEKKEVSFLLDKEKVDTAKERLKVEAAQYRGIDNEGRTFVIDADRAVQATSTEPIVEMQGMAARIQLAEGPATLRAERGRYDMDSQVVDVLGPILFTAADGYRLETRDVAIDLKDRTLAGSNGVEGVMPLGRFSAQRMRVNLPDRTVVLEGRVRLHINQGALR
ncbi:MAG: LPS export ABC transporter periplasmic protein LptC [Allosphingosinicella sp.]